MPEDGSPRDPSGIVLAANHIAWRYGYFIEAYPKLGQSTFHIILALLVSQIVGRIIQLYPDARTDRATIHNLPEDIWHSIISRILTLNPRWAAGIDEIFSAPLHADLDPKLDQATFLVDALAQLIDERPELASELSKQPSFRKVFQSASKGMRSKSKRPIPTEAPELYEGRGKGSGENAVGFLRRVYSDWLPTPLSISDIGDLDPKLYGTLKSWVRDRKPPADLTQFFKSKKRRTPEEIDAELKKHRINKPEDAFARFPNDKKTAARLYNAALRRQ
ncbi:hypothetical protein DW352_13995 [Pseudolabrys taiwanensis]|uniref:Uncharacterized protein n=1 Tax=Pseudolabrys taiwanensis TaxID=331696 RepID=A0A345ZX80_9HYPH|nr:hypothetical protein DW352_13995 [Pseudolabrys taiwanensis]